MTDPRRVPLSPALRAAIYERDKAICQHCGLDCEALAAAIEVWKTYPIIFMVSHRNDAGRNFAFAWPETREFCLAFGRWVWERVKDKRSLWEADHIIPVCEGGTNEAHNLRLLCVPCHRRFSVLLAGRNAKAERRYQKFGMAMA